MTNANEPAFPYVYPGDHVYAYNGLTKREYYAGLAMQGDISEGHVPFPNERSEHWVRCADALIAELAKAEPEDVDAPDDDSWIEWNGGSRPVDSDTLVIPKFRDGTIIAAVKATYLSWYHEVMDDDIVAYRIVKGGEE